MARADDLGPARYHAGLDEAEAAKGSAADFGHEVGNGPGWTAARPLKTARLLGGGCFAGRLGRGFAFHLRAPLTQPSGMS
jgi:hypothetical protein